VQFSICTNTACGVLTDHNTHVDTNHHNPRKFSVGLGHVERRPLLVVPLVGRFRGAAVSGRHSFPRCNKMSLRSVTDMSEGTSGTYTLQIPSTPTLSVDVTNPNHRPRTVTFGVRVELVHVLNMAAYCTSNEQVLTCRSKNSR
jgi:hypothetical protein